MRSGARSFLIWIGLVFGAAVRVLAQDAPPEPAQRLDALSHDTLGVRELIQNLAPGPGTVTPPGSYALSVDGDFELGGFVFKDGAPFLHNDGGYNSRNTALGINALIQSTPGYPDPSSGERNTALGAQALSSNTEGSRNTATGAYALLLNSTASDNTAHGAYALLLNSTGRENTAVGASVLFYNSTGRVNTGVGAFALSSNDTGYFNTAIGGGALPNNPGGARSTAVGTYALYNSTSGSRNTALGSGAGSFHLTGSNNIWIANYGASEDHTLRIGQGTGSGFFELERAFVSGIRGTTTGLDDALAVVIDSDGQLGTVSSSRRVKEDVHDMGRRTAAIADLRPVTFRYRRPFTDGEKPLQYGLIAEEVAEIFPELVTYDDRGRPEAVQYRQLTPMLLNELNRQGIEVGELRRENARLRATLDQLLARVQRLEGNGSASTGPLARAAPISP